MHLRYEAPSPDERTVALAEELVAIIIQADVTYEKTIEALECAQRLIETRTKPVKV